MHETRRDYRHHVATILWTLRHHSGTESSSDALLAALIKLEGFLSFHKLDERSAQRSYHPNARTECSVDNFLGLAILNERKTRRLKEFLSGERSIEGVVKLTLDAVILPPDPEAPGIIPGQGTEEIRKKEFEPRTLELMTLLEREGVFLDDCILTMGTLLPGQMREESYTIIEIPRLNRVVLINDQIGEATYVIYGMGPAEHFVTLTKQDLQENNRVKAKRIIRRSIAKWHTELHLYLFREDVWDESLPVPTTNKPQPKVNIKKLTKYYRTLEAFRDAVLALGIKTAFEYRKLYKEVEKLPAHPERVYLNEWKGWPWVFGRNKDYYETFNEFCEAVRALGIKTSVDYRSFYKNDPRLHSKPDSFYKDNWKTWKWVFYGDEGKYYQTLEEFRDAVLDLGITSGKEFTQRYKEDSRFPSEPRLIYENWKGWDWVFQGDEGRFYKTLEDFRKAVISLGIRTAREYEKLYKRDSKLHSSPHEYYENWRGWPWVFHGDEGKYYQTLEEFRDAVHKLGIQSGTEYRSRHREDKRLPSNPNVFYREKWIDWFWVFGKKKKNHYPTLEEFQDAVLAVGIKSSIEYKSKYKLDEKLHSTPHKFYKDWKGWAWVFGR